MRITNSLWLLLAANLWAQQPQPRPAASATGNPTASPAAAVPMPAPSDFPNLDTEDSEASAPATPPHDPMAAIKLQADSGEYDGKRQLATYSGNVIIEQGLMKLRANKVLIFFAKNKVSKIQGLGNPVKFTYRPKNQPEIIGQGNDVVYDVASDRVMVKGSAYIRQGVNETRASNISYDLRREYLKTGRVNMIFQPSKKK